MLGTVNNLVCFCFVAAFYIFAVSFWENYTGNIKETRFGCTAYGGCLPEKCPSQSPKRCFGSRRCCRLCPGADKTIDSTRVPIIRTFAFTALVAIVGWFIRVGRDAVCVAKSRYNRRLEQSKDFSDAEIPPVKEDVLEEWRRKYTYKSRIFEAAFFFAVILTTGSTAYTLFEALEILKETKCHYLALAAFGCAVFNILETLMYFVIVAEYKAFKTGVRILNALFFLYWIGLLIYLLIIFTR